MRFVGNRRGVGHLFAHPMVWHRGSHRKARGFSWSEIEKSEAYPEGIVAHIIIDDRRKSCLAENIETLRSFMGRGTAQKKVK